MLRRSDTALRSLGLAGLAILGLALAVRIAVVLGTPEYTLLADPADYHRHAVSILAGDGYPESRLAAAGGPTAFRPPLYPFVLASVYEITGAGPTAGRITQALLGTIAVALLGLIAYRIWGRRMALVSMGVGALAPPLLVPGAALLSEPLFLVLELAALAALLEHRHRGGRGYAWLALAGALAGAAILTRTNGVVMLPVLAAAAWTAPRFARRSILAPAVLVAAAALTIAPWTIRNAFTMEAFVPVSTQTGFTLAATYNDAARLDPLLPSAPHYDTEYSPLVRNPAFDEVRLEAELRRRARSYMADHPGYVVQTAVRNLGRSFHIDGLSPARNAAAAVDIPRGLADVGALGFYLIAGLALIGAALPATRRAPLFLWAAPTLVFVSALVVSGKTRYRVVIDPFIILLASLALLAAWDRLKGSRRSSKAGPDGPADVELGR